MCYYIIIILKQSLLDNEKKTFQPNLICCLCEYNIMFYKFIIISKLLTLIIL